MNKIFGSIIGVILITAIPIVGGLAFVIGVNSDHNCIVQHIPAAYGHGTGYEEQPAQVQVEASPHVRWNDLGAHSTGLVLLGFLSFLLGSAIVYLRSDYWDSAWKSIAVFIASWLLGFILIAGKYETQSDSGYTKKIPETIWQDKYDTDCGTLFTNPDFKQYK